jgi:hypothetical protein
MDYLGIEELPKRHILKRWTRDARDILPDHLRVYQTDQGRAKSFTYRHSRIYKKALELVRLGDASVEAYEKLEGLFDNDLAIMAPYNEKRDGLGLEDRPAVDPSTMPADVLATDTGGGYGPELNELEGLGAPVKNRGAGRPTNSRDKAPYEGTGGLTKRTRFCTICRCSGHKRTTCPQRGDIPKEPRKAARCTNCGIAGHRRNTCLKH